MAPRAVSETHATRRAITPQLLTPAEAAQYLGVSIRTFFENIARTVPRVDIRAAGALRPMWRYNRTDLDGWIASQTVQPGIAER